MGLHPTCRLDDHLELPAKLEDRLELLERLDDRLELPARLDDRLELLARLDDQLELLERRPPPPLPLWGVFPASNLHLRVCTLDHHRTTSIFLPLRVWLLGSPRPPG